MGTAAVSSNGHVPSETSLLNDADQELAAAKPEPYRSKNHQKPTILETFEPVVERLDSTTKSLDEVAKRLSEAMLRVGAPAVAIGSVAAPKTKSELEQIAEEVGKIQAQGRLKRTAWSNGDVAYSLPSESTRDVLASTLGLQQEAFVHRSPETAKQHLEVISTSHRAMVAAMDYAKRTLGSDIVIHASDRHLDKVIQYAVEAGLSIKNADPEIQRRVSAEVERQRNPILRDRGDLAREHFPIIERAPQEAQAQNIRRSA